MGHANPDNALGFNGQLLMTQPKGKNGMPDGITFPNARGLLVISVRNINSTATQSRVPIRVITE